MYKHLLESCVSAVRRFNRFYTKKIGVLDGMHLRSAFSLIECRVLYELANREQLTASQIADDLELDAGYLSRILKSFQKQAMVTRKSSSIDARQSILTLTKKGRIEYAALDKKAQDQLAIMLNPLSAPEQTRLMESMYTIERLLDKPSDALVLRTHQPGDMGWIVHRHGALYAQEYGWNGEFEALVAEIVAKFLRDYDPKKERCWIAERNGINVGSISLVKKSAKVAQLRLLFVEPSARGLGIGKRMVEECIHFAKQCGYETMTLWTNSALQSARRIYERAGFEVEDKGEQDSLGKKYAEQIWTLKLK